MIEAIQTFTGNYFLVTVALMFVAAMLLLESLYLFWRSSRGPAAKKIGKRLRSLSPGSDHSNQALLLKPHNLSDVPALERLLQALPRSKGLQAMIGQAGLEWTVSNLLLWSVVAGFMVYLTVSGLLHQSFLIAAIAGLLVAAMPFFYVHLMRNRRLAKMERQLPEAIDLLVRALRSGHAFSSGLQMIGEEMQEPIAGEFRAVHDEVNFGVSLQRALTNLTERVPSTDVRYFVVSVLIQRDSGGNLTEILDNLSRLIRDRLKLLAKVRVLSSEGRLSAWILGLMPFALGAAMNLVNPEFMSPLWTDPIGIVILQYTLGLLVVGVLVMRRIIKIRV